MTTQVEQKGQAWIKGQVMDQGLCTGCGACVGLCPYQAYYKDRTAIIHECDRDWGRCSTYCPRSPGELNRLRAALFDAADIVPELGAVKGLYTTRAADPEVRAVAQHGGTVTALMRLALEEGLIDTAVLAGSEDGLLTKAVDVGQGGQALARAGSKFVVSPTVALFNQASRGDAASIGVVATPCQSLALAKMRVNPVPGDAERIAKLKLVVGLFCGWALSWRELKALIAANTGGAEILGMDIPPSKHACMEVYTPGGTIEIPIEEVQACVRSSCNYCYDMTCEFSDLSVGSSRSPEGWEVDKGWNQVLVRSPKGDELLDLAKARGVLEFKDTAPGNMDKLKAASQKKKETCLERLAELSGSEDQLIYTCKEDVLCQS